VTLVPTLIHSYSGRLDDDTREAAAIPTVLAGLRSVPSERDATWGQRRFSTDNWVEREYSSGTTGDRVRLTVVRSYDAKSVYHHPELAVAYRTSFVGEETRRFPQRPDIPVHILKPAHGVRAGGMYVLHHGSHFVDDPIQFQLRAAVEMLFTRRKPMTLFFVFDQQGPGSEDTGESSAAKLLFAAVDAFLAQKTVSAGAQ
jgi:hypothetical protein